MHGACRTFVVPRRPELPLHATAQLNVAFLGTTAPWSVRVCRRFLLDAEGNPDPGTFTVQAVGPPASPLGYDGAVDAGLGAAMFAAAPAKVFYSRYDMGAGWSLDVYHFAHEGLALATGPASGPVPRWCGREVSADPAYTEAGLAGSAHRA
ncbi:hypothetical protein CLV35_1223 [Motilibacter peucedani]|uniref:Uncharacterized protein n=1 Tax=Motilibacter peucedani TaxID=598650 RepID=A0A420XRP4_9ACTN|nr:hypothetical protein [Motilibacter peucedani]RKS77534.1 hypothetical protein CLV35_1223 [Motilibacter peucedani]